MITKAKIALVAAIVVSVAFSASAATIPAKLPNEFFAASCNVHCKSTVRHIVIMGSPDHLVGAPVRFSKRQFGIKYF